MIGEPYDDTAFDRPQRLSGVHRGGHRVRRPVHRRRGAQDGRQAAIWGGIVGEQFDPCYHEACDDIDNVNLHALEVNSDLIAFAQAATGQASQTRNHTLSDWGRSSVTAPSR